MNRECVQRVLYLMLAASAVASSAAQQNSKTPPPAVAKQQVLELEKEWVAAEVKHDATTLQRILDGKFVASFGAGKPYNKDAFIKLVTSGDPDPTASQTLTDQTVILEDDTAVVVGTDTARETEKGVITTVVYRYTVTYVRRNGRWVALAEHLAEAPQPQ